MAEGRRYYFFNPPPRLSWRERAALAVRAITAHPSCALFFAASISLYCVLLSSNGDLAVVIPVVLFGWALGTVGWCFAPGLSWLKKGAWIVATATIFAASSTYIYWHYHPEWMSSHKIALPPPVASNPINQTIQLRCDQWIIPKTVPENGYYEMVIQPSSGPHGLFIGTGSVPIPGQSNGFSEPVPDNVEKCRFQNFGRAPVVNVQSLLTLRAFEDGKLVATSVEPTPRTNLAAAGSDGASFDFYIHNESPEATVVVVLPTWTKVQAVGSGLWKAATLIPPTENDFTLFPAEYPPTTPVKPTLKHKKKPAPPALAALPPASQSVPPPETATARDPNSIYQRGQAVGSVMAASIIKQQSIVTFGRIYNDCEFDPSQPFEYQSYTLKLSSIPPMTAGQMISPGLGMQACVRDNLTAQMQ